MSRPKAWTAAELELVRKALDEIAKSPAGELVLARTRARNVRVMRRFAFGVRDGAPVPAIAAAYQRAPGNGRIDLFDRLYALGAARDRFSGDPGYSYVAQIILHECMHVIDDRSMTPVFRKTAGFVAAGSKVRFAVTSPAQVAALTQWEAEIRRLESSRDYVAQRVLNRRLALEMSDVRIPTMDSIRGPAEAFAEIGSHLILDEGAASYLPAALVRFFQTQVFKTAGRSQR